MRKGISKKVIAMTFCAVMAAGMLAGLPAGKAIAESPAEAGGEEAERTEGYVQIDDYAESYKDVDELGNTSITNVTYAYLFNTWETDESVMVESYKGISFDKDTNTIILNNADLPEAVLFADIHSSTGKVNIQVNGKNRLRHIQAYTDNDVYIEGTGELSLNDAEENSDIYYNGAFDSGMGKALHIGKDVTVTFVTGTATEYQPGFAIRFGDSGDETETDTSKLLYYDGDVSEEIKWDSDSSGNGAYVINSKLTFSPHTHVYDGYKYDGDNHWQECSKCGEKTAAVPHTWDAGKETTAATTAAEGVKTYTCTVCGATKTEAVPKLPEAQPSDDTKPATETQTPTPSQPTTEAPAQTTVTTGTTATDNSGATYIVTESADGKVEVEYTAPASSKAKKVTIPSTVTVNGVTATVTSIADNAFAGNKTITSVTIPATVEEIGDGAFKNCKKLTKITIPKSVTQIGKNAFSGDKKLKTVNIKSTKIKTIKKNAFKGVPKSTTIKVPKKQKKAYTKLLKKAGFKGKIK